MSVEKDAVLTALRAEDVARHYGIEGAWRGRWMRSSRCSAADHGADAFGISRDGYWHCWACDAGGDLLGLIARGEKMDLRADFPAILAVAARIAGVDDTDDFGAPSVAAPARPARPPIPPLRPLPERITIATNRARWVWGRLLDHDESPRVGRTGKSVADLYLEGRGLDVELLHRVEKIRETPLRCTMEELVNRQELKSLIWSFATPGVAIPVRSVATGVMLDVRVRRFEPRLMADGTKQPKIVGMLGGITAAPAEAGKPRTLLGCYGHPEHIDSDLVICTEGLMDYLTGMVMFPNAQILGAVEAGSMPLVAGHAARELGARDRESRLVIVQQADPPRVLADGTIVPGAADASINESPNAAAKVAIRLLGPRRVGALICGPSGIKDLNDMLCAKIDAQQMIRWAT